MKIHILQHVAFEGPADIENWADANGHRLELIHLYKGDPLPKPGEVEALVIMGGPMSIYDESEHEWLAGEKRFVADCIARACPVLGICLGAQLIAHVLGASVSRNPNTEIGWFPVMRSERQGRGDLFKELPKRFEAFHWHGETFSIPDGARALASSEACANQAFVFKNNVLGLQFHLEATPQSAAALCENAANELVHGRYIQSAHDMLARPQRFLGANRLMYGILDNLFERIRNN